MTTYRLNEKLHGVEIIFDSKPSAETRERLKANGFRWGNGYWYAKQTEERIALAIELSDARVTDSRVTDSRVTAAKVARVKPAQVNKYGVKVGDIFHLSWGYDQTNNDFFQVVALVGKESVRVREIEPKIKSASGIGWGAEDRVYDITNELCEPSVFSVFVKDNEKGDIKRVQVSEWNGTKSAPFIKMDNHWATLCKVGELKVYESWYH